MKHKHNNKIELIGKVDALFNNVSKNGKTYYKMWVSSFDRKDNKWNQFDVVIPNNEECLSAFLTMEKIERGMTIYISGRINPMKKLKNKTALLAINIQKYNKEQEENFTWDLKMGAKNEETK